MRSFTPRRYSRLVRYVIENGTTVPTERGMTKELLNASLLVRNTRDRLVTEGWRKMNFPFAVAEWLAMLTGTASLDLFTNFISSYGSYSSDGKTVDGAYGPRIHEHGDGVKRAIEMLNETRLTRRAVIPIYGGQDLFGGGGLNTPCTLDLQYLVRGGALIGVTNMRSNDLMYGLTNDLTAFTLMHEYIARQSGVLPGPYIHNAASLHIYEPHWNVLDGWDSNELRWNIIMRPMPRLSDDDIHLTQEAFFEIKNTPRVNSLLERIDPWCGELVRAAKTFVTRHDPGEAKVWYSGITDYAIRRVLRPWMTKGEK